MAEENESEDADALAEFERSLAELETLVEALESGDVSLQEALAKFERGVALAQSCQKALKTAELRVEQLTENSDRAAAEDFDPPQEDEEA